MLRYHTLNEQPFILESGAVLPQVQLAYETFGEPNADSSNTVLVAHALTGNTVCTDWWSGLIAKGGAIDPSKDYIICINALGSCYGSTGPESINPDTGAAYHDNFPEITVRDIARSQFLLLQELGISKLRLAIGGSMGGMVILELAVLNAESGLPIEIETLIPIATGYNHSAWRIAFSSTIRRTIERLAKILPDGGISEGLRIARQFGIISYRSREEFDARFGRDRDGNLFEVERYLEHQGDKIVSRFSPYSYIALTRAMELFDLANGRCYIASVCANIAPRTLLVGISSDILYGESEIRAFASLIPNAEYATLDAPYGHDSFLVAAEKLNDIVCAFLDQPEITNPVIIKEEVYA